MKKHLVLVALGALVMLSAFTAATDRSDNPTTEASLFPTELASEATALTDDAAATAEAAAEEALPGPCPCLLTVTNYAPTVPMNYIAKVNGAVVLADNGPASTFISLPRNQISSLTFEAFTLTLPNPCPQAQISYTLTCSGDMTPPAVVTGTINPGTGANCQAFSSAWTVNSACRSFTLM